MYVQPNRTLYGRQGFRADRKPQQKQVTGPTRLTINEASNDAVQLATATTLDELLHVKSQIT